MTKDEPGWKDLAWPALLVSLQLYRLSRGPTGIWFKVILGVTVLWLLLAVINRYTKGKLSDWFDQLGDRPPKVPGDFHAYCLKAKVSPELRLLLADLLEGGEGDSEVADRNPRIASEEDAIAVCAAFKQSLRENPQAARSISRLFRNVGSREAYRIFYHLGMPMVLDQVKAGVSKGEDDSEAMNDVPLLVSYGYEPAFSLIHRLSRAPATCDSIWWTLTFPGLNLKNEDSRRWVAQLGEELPEGGAAASFLEWANQAMIEGELERHPFDSAAGRKKLMEYASGTSEDEKESVANVAVALAFLSSPEELFDVMARHPDPIVRVETSWAKAKRGDARGLEELVALTGDWRLRSRACRYLEELGRAALIPDAVRTPRETALGEMAEWLMHPQELNGMPDELEILDHRELHWPPSADRRSVTLLRWKQRDRQGVGMYGSVTWCFFFSKDMGEASVLDLYAKHCLWEMREKNGKAGQAEDPATGRALLEQANPGENWSPTG